LNAVSQPVAVRLKKHCPVAGLALSGAQTPVEGFKGWISNDFKFKTNCHVPV